MVCFDRRLRSISSSVHNALRNSDRHEETWSISRFRQARNCSGADDAGLGEYLKHTPMVQGEAANAGEFFPIIHTLFSNIKAWLVGTHHGVSAKHLPRYLREWSYLPV